MNLVFAAYAVQNSSDLGQVNKSILIDIIIKEEKRKKALLQKRIRSARAYRRDSGFGGISFQIRIGNAPRIPLENARISHLLWD